jgi:hypothetical protein
MNIWIQVMYNVILLAAVIGSQRGKALALADKVEAEGRTEFQFT